MSWRTSAAAALEFPAQLVDGLLLALEQDAAGGDRTGADALVERLAAVHQDDDPPIIVRDRVERRREPRIAAPLQHEPEDRARDDHARRHNCQYVPSHEETSNIACGFGDRDSVLIQLSHPDISKAHRLTGIGMRLQFDGSGIELLVGRLADV